MCCYWPSKMAHWLEVAGTRSDVLNLIPEIHNAEEQNQLIQVVFCLPHGYHGTCVQHPHNQNKYNKCKIVVNSVTTLVLSSNDFPVASWSFLSLIFSHFSFCYGSAYLHGIVGSRLILSAFRESQIAGNPPSTPAAPVFISSHLATFSFTNSWFLISRSHP